MNNKCPFKDDRCDIWVDYIVNKEELDQANELLGYNWKEICSLYDRIDMLEKYIRSIGREVPSEF